MRRDDLCHQQQMNLQNASLDDLAIALIEKGANISEDELFDDIRFLEDMLMPNKDELGTDDDDEDDADGNDEDEDSAPEDMLLSGADDDDNGMADICESRLFRSKHGIKRYTATDVIDLLFLYCLILVMFKNDCRYVNAASIYAKKTLQYPNFQGFRSGATDLYIASAIVRDHSRMTKLLKGEGLDKKGKCMFSPMRFNLIEYKKFLWNIVYMRNTPANQNWDRQFLFRLERTLKIDKAKYRMFRRTVSRWQSLNHRQKVDTATKILHEMRIRFPMAELRPMLAEFVKVRDYDDYDGMNRFSDEVKPVNARNTAKKMLLYPLAGFALGAALGKLGGR